MQLLHNKKIFIVDRKYLFLISSIIWIGTSILAIRHSIKWLFSEIEFNRLFVIVGGLFLGLFITLLFFGPKSRKIVNRISNYQIKARIYLFHSKIELFTILFFVFSALSVRLTGILPIYLLSILYISLAFGAMYGGIVFFNSFIFDNPDYKWEKKTYFILIKFYCNYYHNTTDNLCDNCEHIYNVIQDRFEKCPNGDNLRCINCNVFCSIPENKDEIKSIIIWSEKKLKKNFPIRWVRYLFNYNKFFK